MLKLLSKYIKLFFLLLLTYI